MISILEELYNQTEQVIQSIDFNALKVATTTTLIIYTTARCHIWAQKFEKLLERPIAPLKESQIDAIHATRIPGINFDGRSRTVGSNDLPKYLGVYEGNTHIGTLYRNRMDLATQYSKEVPQRILDIKKNLEQVLRESR